jgi:hypothetical protein
MTMIYDTRDARLMAERQKALAEAGKAVWHTNADGQVIFGAPETPLRIVPPDPSEEHDRMWRLVCDAARG